MKETINYRGFNIEYDIPYEIYSYYDLKASKNIMAYFCQMAYKNCFGSNARSAEKEDAINLAKQQIFSKIDVLFDVPIKTINELSVKLTETLYYPDYEEAEVDEVVLKTLLDNYNKNRID